MSNPFEALLILIGACFSAGCLGASFAFGAAMVCRHMKWAPVDLTVNINDYREI